MTSPLDTIAAQSREIDLSRLAKPRPTGVYFLVLDGEIIYIGQSCDIDNRIALHVSLGEKSFDRAFWIELPESELDACEGAFIRALNPRECFGAPANTGEDAAILARYGLEPDVEAEMAFAARRKSRRSPPLRQFHEEQRRRRAGSA